MSTFKAMKFWIESPEHGIKIQEALFELGYKWIIYKKHAYYLHGGFIFTNHSGDIARAYADDKRPYDFEDTQETTLEELQAMVGNTKHETDTRHDAINELLNGLLDVIKHAETWNTNQVSALIRINQAIVKLIKDTKTPQ